MWWRRISLALLVAIVAAPAGAQDTASWERGQDGKVDFADLPIDKGGRLTVFCRETGSGMLGGIALSAPSFMTKIIDEQTYGLTLIVDGDRDSLHMVARKIELWFDAEDLNQQTQLARLADDLAKARRLEFGIATIAWRTSINVDNPEAIAGIMDKCL